MKRRSKGQPGELNILLQRQVLSLQEQVKHFTKQLETWNEAKDEARNAWVDVKIKDLNTVIRSINQPRKGESSTELGVRYVEALKVLHDDGLDAAREYFDKPPKEKK